MHAKMAENFKQTACYAGGRHETEAGTGPAGDVANHETHDSGGGTLLTCLRICKQNGNKTKVWIGQTKGSGNGVVCGCQCWCRCHVRRCQVGQNLSYQTASCKCRWQKIQNLETDRNLFADRFAGSAGHARERATTMIGGISFQLPADPTLLLSGVMRRKSWFQDR